MGITFAADGPARKVGLGRETAVSQTPTNCRSASAYRLAGSVGRASRGNDRPDCDRANDLNADHHRHENDGRGYGRDRDDVRVMGRSYEPLRSETCRPRAHPQDGQAVQ